jgi:hypothetical protein
LEVIVASPVLSAMAVVALVAAVVTLGSAAGLW